MLVKVCNVIENYLDIDIYKITDFLRGFHPYYNAYRFSVNNLNLPSKVVLNKQSIRVDFPTPVSPEIKNNFLKQNFYWRKLIDQIELAETASMSFTRDKTILFQLNIERMILNTF